MLNLIRPGAIDIVVIDSVAVSIIKSEIEGEMGILKWPTRLMSQALRKLTGTISKTNCTVFFINQLREKIELCLETRDYNWRKCIEVLCFSTFRHPSFYQIKDGDNVIGNRTKSKKSLKIK
jgi:recombination protein RecA